MSASERNTLPGGPSNRMVRDVRRVLFTYVRCRPQRHDTLWRDAWAWADACRRRDDLFNFSKRPARWPAATEIASQYLLLALAAMRECHALRLPFRAPSCMTPAVIARLGAAGSKGVLSFQGAKPAKRLRLQAPRISTPVDEGSGILPGPVDEGSPPGE